MVSILTCKACLHPAPAIKCGPSSSRRVFRSTQSRLCPNSRGFASYLKTGIIYSGMHGKKFGPSSHCRTHIVNYNNITSYGCADAAEYCDFKTLLKKPGSEAWRRERSMRQVTKAGEAETAVQQESEPSKTDEKPSDTTEATKVVEEGAAVGKYWVLRCASEGDGKKQEIVGGDGLLVGAAPNVTGSSTPFVVDYPMVSGTHARVYGRERKSYQTTVQEYFVMDLGSTNGTYLNRSKLRPNTEVKLSPGDTLKFGDEKATFVVEGQD